MCYSIHPTPACGRLNHFLETLHFAGDYFGRLFQTIAGVSSTVFQTRGTTSPRTAFKCKNVIQAVDTADGVVTALRAGVDLYKLGRGAVFFKENEQLPGTFLRGHQLSNGEYVTSEGDPLICNSWREIVGNVLCVGARLTSTARWFDRKLYSLNDQTRTRVCAAETGLGMAVCSLFFSTAVYDLATQPKFSHLVHAFRTFCDLSACALGVAAQACANRALGIARAVVSAFAGLVWFLSEGFSYNA